MTVPLRSTAARAGLEVRRACASATSRAVDLRPADGWGPARLRALETVEKVLTKESVGRCPVPLDALHIGSA
jgi:hypothetical protein